MDEISIPGKWFYGDIQNWGFHEKEVLEKATKPFHPPPSGKHTVFSESPPIWIKNIQRNKLIDYDKTRFYLKP